MTDPDQTESNPSHPTNMSIYQRKQDESDKMVFDGNPVDLDRFLAHCSVILLTELADTASEGEKCAVLAKRLRGPALDWLASEMATPSPNIMGDLERFKTRIRGAFGLSGAQQQIKIRQDLDELRMSGDVLMFFTAFEGLTSSLGIASDVSRMQILLPKLDAPTRTAMANSGQAINTYTQFRAFCVNRYAFGGGQGTTKQAKAKCGNCGKKGHTSGQCHSK